MDLSHKYCPQPLQHPSAVGGCHLKPCYQKSSDGWLPWVPNSEKYRVWMQQMWIKLNKQTNKNFGTILKPAIYLWIKPAIYLLTQGFIYLCFLSGNTDWTTNNPPQATFSSEYLWGNSVCTMLFPRSLVLASINAIHLFLYHQNRRGDMMFQVIKQNYLHLECF